MATWTSYVKGGRVKKLYKPLKDPPFLHELGDVGMDDAAKTSGHPLSNSYLF